VVGPLTPQSIIKNLDLEPLPDEGGLYRQTHSDENSSAIYYLLVAPSFSALHRLKSPEVFHFYAGSPARMLLLHSSGSIEEPELGLDLTAGQRPQVTVPAGVWQATETVGGWSLLGTTMAPPFEWEAFELGRGDELERRWPAAATRIARLAVR